VAAILLILTSTNGSDIKVTSQDVT